MAAAVPPTSGSLWSNLNPLKLPNYLHQVVSRTFWETSTDHDATLADRDVVVIRTTDDPEPFVLIGDSYQNIFEYFNQSTRPYPLREILVRDSRGGSVKLEIPAYFLSDLERSGVQDSFFLDGKELTPPPKTEKQKVALLGWMLQKAEGNSEKVKRWASLWNFRAKFVLVDLLRKEIKEKYGLDPSMNSACKSVTSFNTATGELSCSLCGSVDRGTSPELDSKKYTRRGVPIKISYQAQLLYDVTKGSIEEKLVFFDEPL